MLIGKGGADAGMVRLLCSRSGGGWVNKQLLGSMICLRDLTGILLRLRPKTFRPGYMWPSWAVYVQGWFRLWFTTGRNITWDVEPSPPSYPYQNLCQAAPYAFHMDQTSNQQNFWVPSFKKNANNLIAMDDYQPVPSYARNLDGNCSTVSQMMSDMGYLEPKEFSRCVWICSKDVSSASGIQYRPDSDSCSDQAASAGQIMAIMKRRSGLSPAPAAGIKLTNWAKTYKLSPVCVQLCLIQTQANRNWRQYLCPLLQHV